MDKTHLLRFQKFIELDLLEGCWLWKGTLRNGYGRFYLNGKDGYAHVASFEHWNGKIENNLEIDHLCRNRNCCNPSHLEQVTHRENIVRSTSLYCAKGHIKRGDNLIITKKRMRVCRICKNNWNVEYRRRLVVS